MNLRILFLLCIFYPLAASAQDFGNVDTRSIDAALFQVVGSPAKYDKKVIRVFGIYYWNRDGSYLFLTRDHYDAFDTASALELAVAEKYLPVNINEIEKLQGRPVTLEGTLRAAEGIRGGPVLVPITRILVRGSAVHAPNPSK
jgi:hypothetical protein